MNEFTGLFRFGKSSVQLIQYKSATQEKLHSNS